MPVSVTVNASAYGRREWSSSVVGPTRQLHAARVGELQRVGEQVAQDLRDALLVGDDVGRRVLARPRRTSSRPFSSATGRNERSRPSSTSASVQRRRVDLHLARLDLGQVEDVGDQRQQVGARLVDRAGELDLLVGQVLRRVVGQQLGQDQQRVERRAQLVAHVGQELALVARGQRELLGAFLERQARALDLGVLDLDVAVLLGEQRRLLLQLLVGLAQLLLLGLQQLLGRAQRLRLLLELGVGALELVLLGLQLLRLRLQLLREPALLLEQVLGAVVGDDRRQDDADRLRQLVEEATG